MPAYFYTNDTLLRRVTVKAADHDFSTNYVTSFGILDLTNDNVDLTFTESKVIADFIVYKKNYPVCR